MKQKIFVYLGIMFSLAAIYNIAYNLDFTFSVYFNTDLEGSFWFKDYNNSWGKRGFVQLGIILVLSSAISFFLFRRKMLNKELFIHRLRRFFCYFLSFIFFGYGFAKVFGNQFSMFTFIADKPLSELNGFEWTWLYFSYSYVYGLFIAFSQFTGAILLVFNRTKYIGALLLVPVIVNIIFIDYCYHIGNDVKVISVFYLLVLVYILQPVLEPLFHLLVVKSATAGSRLIQGNLKYAILKVLLVFAIIFNSFFFNDKLKMQEHFSQPVTGVWKTENVFINNKTYPGDEANDSVPNKIYFEKGGFCYIKYSKADDMENCKIVSDSIYLNNDSHTLDFTGKFQLRDSLLVLTGTTHKTIPVVYRLKLIRRIT
jgi:hypothetical protein